MKPAKPSSIVELFNKHISLLTIGTVLIYFGTIIVNYLLNDWRSLFYGTTTISSFFHFSAFPIVLICGVLLYLVFVLVKRYEESQKKLREMEAKNREYEDMLKQYQSVAGFVLQTVTKENDTLREWIQRRSEAGKAPTVVEQVSQRIAHSLNLFSRTYFLLPYVQQHVEVPVTQEAKMAAPPNLLQR